MFRKAHAYESAQKHSESYLISQSQSHHSASTFPPNDKNEPFPLSAAQKPNNEICYFCGSNRHPRSKCHAREIDCNKCGKKRHFAEVCKSSKPVNNSAGTKPVLLLIVEAQTALYIQI